MAKFPVLDSEYVATGHDFSLPFRAALVGQVVVLGEELVQRRMHTDNWNWGIWDMRSQAAADFGEALYLLGAYRAMMSDVACAADLSIVIGTDAAQLASRVRGLRDDANEQLLTASQTLFRSGRVPLWVTEHEVKLAGQGNLLALLARRARRAALVRWVLRIRQSFSRWFGQR